MTVFHDLEPIYGMTLENNLKCNRKDGGPIILSLLYIHVSVWVYKVCVSVYVFIYI